MAADPVGPVPSAPVPVPDLDTAPFLSALRDEQLLLQRCDACGRHRFPPMPSCPWCGAERHVFEAVAGVGQVYSFVTVHRPLTPAFADEVPYVIATVDLDVGCRIFGRLEAPDGSTPDVVRIGRRVVARFVHHADWTEVRFVGDNIGEQR
ncbi:MAG: OB-fold domain-containing protein [Acidimicrobiales bacterium]|nr:OB-fold domain-containing protein [Acidimicrobiales bacterium]